MKILFSHNGRRGKDGWGRFFYLAKAMVSLGHDVVYLTTREEFSMFKVVKSIEHGVVVLSFSDFMPSKLKSSGFGSISVVRKSLYALLNEFDLVISHNCHRPSGLPCLINSRIYNSIHVAEWWDYYGRGGYFDNKPFLFKLLFGRRELNGEIKVRKAADIVVVLSEEMRERALNEGISNVIVVHGGCLTNEIRPSIPSIKSKEKIVFGYIGMSNSEVSNILPFFQAIRKSEFRDKFEVVTYGSFIDQKYIDEYDLASCIEERGWLDYLSDSTGLDDVDVFVQLLDNSRVSRAGWPNKVGDYLAYGKPILLHPYGDLEKFVEMYPKGFIVVKYDYKDIMEKIHDLLEGKYDLYKMGRANRQLAEENTWEHKAQDLLELYYQLY